VCGEDYFFIIAAVREGAEQEGHEVRGLAPTSRAAHKVAESGIMSGFGGKPSVPPLPRDQSPEANEDVVGTTESRTLLESIT